MLFVLITSLTLYFEIHIISFSIIMSHFFLLLINPKSFNTTAIHLECNFNFQSIFNLNSFFPTTKFISLIDKFHLKIIILN